MATIAPSSAAKRVRDLGQEETSKDDDHTPFAQTPAPTWTANEASSYLAAVSYLPHSVAGNCKKLEVDGSTLLRLSSEGWRELASPDSITYIAIAKIQAALSKLATASPVPNTHHRSPAAFRAAPELDTGFKSMLKFFASKTFEGGAEHTRQWNPCIANANLDGGQTKAHVLRFLGMYNVVDLLTFTIGMQFLLEEKKEMHEGEGFIENIFDLIIVFICILSCVLSGTGMTASTIVYNSSSAVHECNMQAFVKSPGVTGALMFVNDASIWGFNFLCMGAVFTSLKFAWSDNKLETSFDFARAIILTFPVLYLFFLIGARIDSAVSFSTHYALYAGLMSDQEVIPEKVRRREWRSDELRKLVC